MQLLRTLKNPSASGWGLTSDSVHLIMRYVSQGLVIYTAICWSDDSMCELKLTDWFSDGTSKIRFLDPKTFEVNRTITVTDNKRREVKKLNELEFIDQQIWANVWMSNNIVKIDPATGNTSPHYTCRC